MKVFRKIIIVKTMWGKRLSKALIRPNLSSGAAGAVPKLEHPPAREARRCRVLLVAGLVAQPLLTFFVLGQESASTVWEMASATFTVVLEPVRDVAWRYYKHFPYAPSPAGLGMAVIIWICTAPEPIHLLYIPSVLPLCSSSLPRQIHHPCSTSAKFLLHTTSSTPQRPI